MNATARHLIRRITAAVRTAAQVSRATRYTALNGAISTLVANGDLVQASAHLRRLGLTDDQIRSTRSNFGKTVKAAYRSTTGTAPMKCWIEIDGRYRSVYVYLPFDRALAAGVTAYKRLAALVAQTPATETA